MLGAILAHKHLIIAAVAISGLVVYAFPYNMLASANHGTLFNFDRTIQIPCVPYCNISIPDVNVDTGTVHVRIGFSFVPI
jgi:hypothetical protein